MLLGAESIRPFSIALLIGLIAGTYSSIFISAQIWFDLKKREMKEKGAIKVDKEKKQWGSDEPVVLDKFHNIHGTGYTLCISCSIFFMKGEMTI